MFGAVPTHFFLPRRCNAIRCGFVTLAYCSRVHWDWALNPNSDPKPKLAQLDKKSYGNGKNINQTPPCCQSGSRYKTQTLRLNKVFDEQKLGLLGSCRRHV